MVGTKQNTDLRYFQIKHFANKITQSIKGEKKKKDIIQFHFVDELLEQKYLVTVLQ